MKLQKLTYPWVSIVSAILLVAYNLLATDSALISYYQLPAQYFSPSIQLVLLTIFIGIVLTDIRIFNSRNTLYKKQLQTLNDRVDELLTAKKNLQTRAHTLSGHADKLKLFISDRLLEYIEYDEKFLHFKSIAAEVRHNGVICFDKVQTALQESLENANENNREEFQDALQSMVYLWDLLELSTTDNLALHISNYLCECEEHYYQDILQDENLSEMLRPPTFSPRKAAIKTLNKYLEKPLQLKAADSTEENHKSLELQNNIFRINLAPGEPLLGNENHIILLLENLINNALFFANKKSFRHKYARTAVTLEAADGKACFSIFNHGPHIDEETADKLFKLGYSTRRVRAHNGKGLGLYFVNEIVKGYEGKIAFSNISSQEQTYYLRIKYSDGSIITETLQTSIKGNRIKCSRSDEESLSARLEWSSRKQVDSMEISRQTMKEPYTFIPSNNQNQAFLDPENPAIPCWAIELCQKPRSSKITFIPIDVNGVCFTVEIPDAASRLDYSETDENQGMDEPDLDSLEENFPNPEKLIA